MDQNTRRRFIPITKWHEHHDWPSEAGLRHLRFHCKTNGFEKAFVKSGRRVLVDEGEFFDALLRQQSKAA